MFRVENADFIANKLAAELLPDQEQREAFVNAHEAVTRRMEASGVDAGGRIELDVDWFMLSTTGGWFISCADNGDGMSKAELEKYMTTLAVQGAGQNQSLSGNQGMGLKISGPTRHKRGVLIRSLKNGEATVVQVGWDGSEYGLIAIGEHGEFIGRGAIGSFPEFIQEQGSGTVVTFLGNDEGDNTFLPNGKIKNWLFKYMNQRFFRLSGDGIEAFVRVPSGDLDAWPVTREEASERQRGEGGKSFNLSRVRGTANVWDEASTKIDPAAHGHVDLPGMAAAGIPAARMHWWVLPSGKGSDVSSRTASGGSLAIAYQNELHDWRSGNQANPFLARLGILFGKNRFGFIMEPLGSSVTSDFARSHVLLDNTPVLESQGWLVWADQFREAMPDPIREAMAEEQARLQDEDPDRARRIRDRLKDVMGLNRPKRARPNPDGKSSGGDRTLTGPTEGGGSSYEVQVGAGTRKRTDNPRGLGAALVQVDAEGDPADEVFTMLRITPKWVSESEAETISIVNGNARGIKDRAAALAGEDGATAGLLLLNTEFRGYRNLVDSLCDWGNPDGDEEVAKAIETFTQEWVEQKMVESVTGLRQLENGSSWTATNFDEALSPVALTAAFMADRYHTLREVRRQVGPLRRQAVVEPD